MRQSFWPRVETLNQVFGPTIVSLHPPTGLSGRYFWGSLDVWVSHYLSLQFGHVLALFLQGVTLILTARLAGTILGARRGRTFTLLFALPLIAKGIPLTAAGGDFTHLSSALLPLFLIAVAANLIIQKVFTDDIASITSSTNEISNSKIREAFHNMPKNRATSDLDHRFWSLLSLLPESGS